MWDTLSMKISLSTGCKLSGKRVLGEGRITGREVGRVIFAQKKERLSHNQQHVKQRD